MNVRSLAKVGFTVAATLLANIASAEESFDVRISFFLPESSPVWQEVIKPFGDELEKESGGRLKVTHYPAEVLHTVADGFRAVATGITDIAAAWPVYSANSFKLFLATELPLAFPSSNVASVRIMDELYPRYFKDEYERMGVRLAFNAMTADYDILTAKPVNSMDDLKGLKIRAAGGAISEIIERLGATPITMPISDAYVSFQQGVVDGIIMSSADMVDHRMYEVGKYNYRIGIARVAIPYAVNNAFYDGLPNDLKKIFDEAGRSASYNYQEMYTRVTAKAFERMKAEGVRVVEPSDEDKEKMRELLAPMWESFIERNSDVSDPSAEQLISDIQDLSARYGELSDWELLELKDYDPVEGLR